MKVNFADDHVSTRKIMSQFIVPMKGSPFAFRKDEAYDALKRSIAQFGVIDPITVLEPEKYARTDGNYQIISGRRRYEACKELGIIDIPARVLRMPADDAIIALIDMNLCQRTDIPPSEKGAAYKLRLEAMKRQGYRTDLEADPTSSQVGTKFNAGKELSETTEDSRTQIYRYIRLTELEPELQQLVDEGRIALGPAVELSYLPWDAQKAVYAYYDENEVTPSYSQANQMKKYSAEGTLTPETMLQILDQPKANQVEMFRIPIERIRPFFGPKTSKDKMLDVIVKALELYARTQARKRNDRDAR